MKENILITVILVQLVITTMLGVDLNSVSKQLGRLKSEQKSETSWTDVDSSDGYLFVQMQHNGTVDEDYNYRVAAFDSNNNLLSYAIMGQSLTPINKGGYRLGGNFYTITSRDGAIIKVQKVKK